MQIARTAPVVGGLLAAALSLGGPAPAEAARRAPIVFSVSSFCDQSGGDDCPTRVGVMGPRGEGRHRLSCSFRDFGQCFDAFPRLSPDRRLIATGIQKAIGRSQITIRRLDGPVLRRVSLPDAPSDLAWSPDGRWLAVNTGRQIRLFGMAGGPGRLVRGSGRPAIGSDVDWSPRGRLAWTTSVTGRVMVTDRRRRNPTAVPGIAGDIPRWSPDGRRLAYFSTHDGVFVVPPDGRGRRRVGRGCVHPDDNGLNPLGVGPNMAWSPDGREIACVAPKERVVAYDVATGRPRTVVRRLNRVYGLDW